MLFNPAEGSSALEKAVDELCHKAEQAVNDKYHYIILSDRGVDENNVPIPSLLAVSAVHHYLIEKRKRMQIAVVVETAEPREVMHFALLFGYGATAVNPYLSFAILEDLVNRHELQLDFHTAEKNYIKSINKGY
jgi:glutamate synthase (NADPH/NADH) large chain